MKFGSLHKTLFFIVFSPFKLFSKLHFHDCGAFESGPGDSAVWFILQGCTTISLGKRRASYLKFFYVSANNNALTATWNKNCCHWWFSSPNEETCARQYKPIGSTLYCLPCIFSHYYYLYCWWWNISFPWQLSKCSLDVVLKKYSCFNTNEAQSIALGLTMEVNGPNFGGFKSGNVNNFL